MGLERHHIADKRSGERTPVLHRTRGVGPTGGPLSLVIVDLSFSGLMARCEGEFARGAHVQINLPMIGMWLAEVRWSLGGRIGCAFDTPIGLHDYYAVLAALNPAVR